MTKETADKEMLESYEILKAEFPEITWEKAVEITMGIRNHIRDYLTLQSNDRN